MGRLGLALQSFLLVLRDKGKAERIHNIVYETPSEGIQLLAILQREGRLVDFLKEDISRYNDAQIGAAARTVHTGCRKALEEVLDIQPIQKEQEGTLITIEKDFDPSTVRLTGHVVGEPPFKGTLRHHGWQVEKIKFPPLPKGQDPKVVSPAEVEIPLPPKNKGI